MTIKEALRQAREQLARAGIEPAPFEARELAAACFGLSVSQLSLRGGEQAADDGLRELERLTARRAAGEPLQYLLGEWEFYGLPFYVGEGVLIPRPDTELLVDAALARLAAGRPSRILDLCAGSGCIAAAVTKNRPGCEAAALEKSPAALSYLRRNIRRIGVPVRVVAGDLFDGPAVLGQPAARFDLILSNPPYIPAADLPGLDREVKREPVTALDGGADGLRFYRAICTLWLTCLRPGGSLLVEIGIGQSVQVQALFREAGLEEVEALPDLSGIDRVIVGTLPEMTY